MIANKTFKGRPTGRLIERLCSKMEGELTKVRKDHKSLYIKAGGYIARPGAVRGYDHAYDMTDGGLVEGDTVKAAHMASTPLTKITLPDGRKIVWHHE